MKYKKVQKISANRKGAQDAVAWMLDHGILLTVAVLATEGLVMGLHEEFTEDEGETLSKIMKNVIDRLMEQTRVEEEK